MTEGEITMKRKLYETPEVSLFLVRPKDFLTLSDNDVIWDTGEWYDDDDIFE